jgi:hypothetical protein
MLSANAIDARCYGGVTVCERAVKVEQDCPVKGRHRESPAVVNCDRAFEYGIVGEIAPAKFAFDCGEFDTLAFDDGYRISQNPLAPRVREARA